MHAAVIGQETIEQVRSRTGIVEVIGETVKLKRQGRSFVGLCPFHEEKTPSFSVNEERGLYYCFGCKASGDAIKFVQEIEGLSFIEAVRRLAERAGISIVEQASEPELKRQAEARRRQQELYDVGAAAAEYFEQMLREHPLAHLARRELERRELVPDSATGPIADALQAFRIGYAPYAWDGLARRLLESGLSHQAAEKAGLLAPRKNSAGHYDRFRHRLMFAVIDLQGRVIAFSGRALDEPKPEELLSVAVESMGSSEPPAKYVNTSETPIYHKGSTVFGLYQARQAIRSAEECVLVEGNFDVVSLHARGIKNVVAPLGTALTVDQAKLMRRFAPRVVLLFDGDGAGKRATAAARSTCLEAGLSARVAALPDGTDPDELVRSRGATGIEALVQAAQGLGEHLIQAALDAAFTAPDVQERARGVGAVAELIKAEPDPAARALLEAHADQLVQRHASRGAAGSDADARTFRALASIVHRAVAEAEGRARPAAPQGSSAQQPPERARSRSRREEIAQEIFGALLDYPELLDTPEAVAGAELIEGDLAAGFAALRQLSSSRSPANYEVVLAKLPASIHPFALARLAAPRHERVDDARTELLENVKKLKGLAHARQNSQELGEIERAAKTGDFERQIELLRERQQRARKRHGLGER